MTTGIRRLVIGVLALVWLAVVLSWGFGLPISQAPVFGWVAFLCVVVPAVGALHLLGKRLGATRSPRRRDDV